MKLSLKRILQIALILSVAIYIFYMLMTPLGFDLRAYFVIFLCSVFTAFNYELLIYIIKIIVNK